MNILNIIGNHINDGNGIGRLIPEMVLMHNNLSDGINSKILTIQKCEGSEQIINYKDIANYSTFFSGFDLIIFHGVFFIEYIKISKILKNNKIPYLVKPHSSLMVEGLKKSWIKKKLASYLFFKRFVNNSNGIIYTNNDEKLNSVLWNESFFIEPNGIKTELLFNGRNRKFKEKRRFIYLSRIDFNHKGTDILLDAIKYLKDINVIEQIELDIYGRGNAKEEKKLINIISALNCDNIKFKGPVFGENKNIAFSKSDIFILTSRYEGFPMVLLESLYAGLPCIVTPGTNMKHIVSEHNVGWLVDGNYKAIANKILDVLAEPNEKLKSISVNGIEYVKNHHDWTNVVSISEKIYKEVIKGKE
ncbi:glycosyltransferase [Photobacterium damselae]|nr:glycosyltransferase [Photobacterium damselae]